MYRYSKTIINNGNNDPSLTSLELKCMSIRELTGADSQANNEKRADTES